jgi:hypothetical protein
MKKTTSMLKLQILILLIGTCIFLPLQAAFADQYVWENFERPPPLSMGTLEPRIAYDFFDASRWNGGAVPPDRMLIPHAVTFRLHIVPDTSDPANAPVVLSSHDYTIEFDPLEDITADDDLTYTHFWFEHTGMGAATFRHLSGDLTITSSFAVAEGTPDDLLWPGGSIYRMEGGTLNLLGYPNIIGTLGSRHTLFELTGGVVNGPLNIGSRGVGHYAQTGGVYNTTRNCSIGRLYLTNDEAPEDVGVATFTMTGGEANINWLNAGGRYGSALLDLSGGTFNFQQVVLGTPGMRPATMIIRGNARVNPDAGNTHVLYITAEPGETSEVIQSGQTEAFYSMLKLTKNTKYTLSSGDVYVRGIYNNGYFMQSGGLVRIIPPPYPTSPYYKTSLSTGNSGTYDLSGGELSSETISVNGSGLFLQSGGTVTADELIVNGEYRQQAGVINAGTVTNNGAMSFLCDASTEISFGDLIIGEEGFLAADSGCAITVSGNFTNQSTQNTQLDAAEATLRFGGNDPDNTTHSISVTGDDFGADPDGFENNFAWRVLQIAPGNSLVLSGSPGKALYVRTLSGLSISGAAVSNITGNGLNIYYNGNAECGTYDLQNGGQLIPVQAFFRTGLVPDTGQTASYTDVFGEDSDYTANPQSFTKLDESGNELASGATVFSMVRDNVTGLIWEVKHNKDETVNYDDPNDGDNKYTWYNGTTGQPCDGTIDAYPCRAYCFDTLDFLNDLNSANYGGRNDWRLPTQKELASLFQFVNSAASGSAIDVTYFPSMYYIHFDYLTYWTSTLFPENEYLDVSYVNFYSGGTWEGPFYSSLYVRAVSGSEQAANDFVNNSDGTVTDQATGLMWQLSAPSDNVPDLLNPIDADNTRPWEDALVWAEELILNNDGAWTSGAPNASGAKYDDWRLPNAKELFSLVDENHFSPSIDAAYFPNTLGGFKYWSSTVAAPNTTSSKTINFGWGQFGWQDQQRDWYCTRAVRGGYRSCGIEIFKDSDGDGLPDSVEDKNGNGIVDPGETDPFDADTDDDGIIDGIEDTNHNGIVDAGETNPCSSDSDADGVQDGTEIGLTTSAISIDTDLSVFIADEDTASITYPTIPDTDGDGFTDGEEDSNYNGVVELGETDPTTKMGDVDGNGIQDLTDLLLALKGMSGLENSGSFAGDRNGDGKIGLAEAIYILQKVVTESD